MAQKFFVTFFSNYGKLVGTLKGRLGATEITVDTPYAQVTLPIEDGGRIVVLPHEEPRPQLIQRPPKQLNLFNEGQ